jgi:hypothetical protein
MGRGSSRRAGPPRTEPSGTRRASAVRARSPYITLRSMESICSDLLENADDVLAQWERLVREYPWFSLPAAYRTDNLADVLAGLVRSALCEPSVRATQWENVNAASAHGEHRRRQGIPEHLLFTEFHLLRQEIWQHLVSAHPPSEAATGAMLRIDAAISLATNASMWGYHREEIEAMGKWEEGMERIVASSPFLARSGARTITHPTPPNESR